MDKWLEKFKETIKQCLEALRDAPPEISRKLAKLLSEFDQFITSHPELAAKALPCILSILRCIILKKYAEALWWVAGLLTLIRSEYQQK